MKMKRKSVGAVVLVEHSVPFVVPVAPVYVPRQPKVRLCLFYTIFLLLLQLLLLLCFGGGLIFLFFLFFKNLSFHGFVSIFWNLQLC
jgi:hypothetical protein